MYEMIMCCRSLRSPAEAHAKSFQLRKLPGCGGTVLQRLFDMASSSHSVNGQNGVQFGPDPALVRDQLRRLVAHPLFTNSKRYPVLLTYTVEQTLLGNASELKERTIGIEAFGREPVYDVNLDPVVRTAAAEVRKRLSQYYYNPDHAGELVIELPIGSYVPTFREPAASQMGGVAEPLVGEKVESLPKDSVFQSLPHAETEQAYSQLVTPRWIPITIALLIAALIGFSVGRVRVPSQAAVAGEPSNMSRFWQPITSTSSRVTYCLGAPTDSVDLQNREYPVSEGGSLNTYDVITLARSLVPLVPKNAQFRVLSASDTGFAQLREGPFVLIGAFDNPWTMRITQDLPMGFEYENHVREVVDRKSAPKKIWTLQWQVPGKSLARDYAIVARLHDTVTGEPVVILAGILGEGTEAASEVVSNPAYLDAMLQKAPKNWDQLNLEAVIEANVIDGHPGPPTVIAVETW